MQFILVCITLVVLAVACSATLQEQYDRLQKRALLSDPVTGMSACLSCYVSNASYPMFLCTYLSAALHLLPTSSPALAFSSDFDTYTFTPSSDGKNHLANTHVTGNYNSTGRPYSAFFATFHPSSFSFLPARPDGCTKLEMTSRSSVEPWHTACAYATNAGELRAGSVHCAV